MTRPFLTLLAALAMLLQATIGSPAAHADYVAAPICHTGGGHDPASGDTSHECLACPICSVMAQPAMLLPPSVVVPRSHRLAPVGTERRAGRPMVVARTWTVLPRGPPRAV